MTDAILNIETATQYVRNVFAKNNETVIGAMSGSFISVDGQEAVVIRGSLQDWNPEKTKFREVKFSFEVWVEDGKLYGEW